MSPETETKRDYEIANEEAKNLLASLEITTTCSAGVPDVRDDWPNILYNLTFTRGGKSFSTEYRLGVGHAKIEKVRGGSAAIFVNGKLLHGLTADEESGIYAITNNRSVQFKDKSLHARIAAKVANAQKIQPQAHEVLASCCRDAMDARNESFESWASNFGYDADSIKAKRIYDTCAEIYHKLTAIIDAKTIQQFAELSARF